MFTPSSLQQPAALERAGQLSCFCWHRGIEQLAQFAPEAVATGADKRIRMSEYASGNYAVSDIHAIFPGTPLQR